MARTYGIVDLFAGPGGLGEGFARFTRTGRAPFRILLSAEKERAAHRTLRLRTFFRELERETTGFPDQCLPLLSEDRPSEEELCRDHPLWQAAEREARRLEVGTRDAAEAIDATIAQARRSFDDTILIGGPPCQAYSLVGRSRNMGVAGYTARDDHRHFLYREYLRVLAKLRPAVFVMENVKGMLSSAVDGRPIFECILEDIRAVGDYEAMPLTDRGCDLFSEWTGDPRSFVIRAEEHGVPQARHRVIIVGLRRDIAAGLSSAPHDRLILPRRPEVASDVVLGSMPRLRSRLSRGGDSNARWSDTMRAIAQEMHGILRSTRTPLPERVAERLRYVSAAIARDNRQFPASSREAAHFGPECTDRLAAWLGRAQPPMLASHEARGHMPGDLARYLFAAVHADATGRSPVMEDFPRALWPQHANWTTGKFRDRFRVQLRGRPSTTVTSHISKDGHYYIHPDPMQCRSLTVREAARLQTFPDDYLFMGNRTEQYVQVGNAVPPFLAHQIAEVVHAVLEASATPVSERIKAAE